ncbi:MAG: zinc-binding dehydrogenase [Planctomycetota bacterium]
MEATAAHLVGRRRVELRPLELEPQEDQVLIRIAACGICHGDLQIFDREHDEPRRFGHEPVGEVMALGPWADELAEGDRVVGCLHGGFATHTVARESEVFRVPDDLGDEDACLAEALKCVTTLSRAALPDFGDVVVVVGCGFMGLSAISILAGTWKSELIAVDPVESRRAMALEFGATQALDPTAGDAREQVLELTGGRGADVAVEFAGRPEAVTIAARSLRRRGRLVLGGGHSVGDEEDVAIYMSAITVHHAPPAFSPDEADDWRRAIDAMAAGRFPLQRLVSHRFRLSDIQDAFETASAGAEIGYRKGIVLNDIA